MCDKCDKTDPVSVPPNDGLLNSGPYYVAVDIKRGTGIPCIDALRQEFDDRVVELLTALRKNNG